jgi:hypothetical protein
MHYYAEGANVVWFNLEGGGNKDWRDFFCGQHQRQVRELTS